MILSLVLLLVFVGLIYRKRFVGHSIHALITKRGPLHWVVAVIVVPALVISTLFPSLDYSNYSKLTSLAEKYANKEMFLRGLSGWAAEEPENLALQIRFINEYVRQKRNQSDFSCLPLLERYDNSEEWHNRMAYAYTDFYCRGQMMNIPYLNTLSDTMPFVNFFKSLYFLSAGELVQTEYHLKEEMSLQPDFDLPYLAAYRLYASLDEEKLEAFMRDWNHAKHLPGRLNNTYYFEQGLWSHYAFNLLHMRLGGVSLLTLCAAFSVSFIWILFMRALDVFNRESWRDILIVFALGSFCTFLCLPIYDFADLVLNFSINGEAWNDFLYCTLVIGGSEELVKFIPWMVFGWYARKLKEPFDYILYASVAALGFAFVENLMYLENYHNIVVRSIMSTVGHMFDATIIAYAFVIARFRVQQVKWKVVVIAAGFALALLAHGFYDFWLISPAANGLELLTLLFFISSLHMWFFFKNNALNHSPYFCGEFKFNSFYQQDLLTISFVAIVMLEFTLLGIDLGAEIATESLKSSVLYAGAFILYISYQIDKLAIRQGVWNKFTLEHVGLGRLKQWLNWAQHAGYSTVQDQPLRDAVGLKLRFFTSKSNHYIGEQLPISGECMRPVRMNGRPGFYVVKLNTPLVFGAYERNFVIVGTKEKSHHLNMDKVEVIFLLIPDPRMVNNLQFRIEELRYTGRVYSRPLE